MKFRLLLIAFLNSFCKKIVKCVVWHLVMNKNTVMSSYFQELNFPWNFQCCPHSKDVLMIVSGVVPWHRCLSVPQRAVHMCKSYRYYF